MHVLQFIQANFWILLAMCGVVFVLGIVLWIIGNAMVREGQRRMLFAQEYRHREMMAMNGGGRFTGPPSPQSEYLYPPVQDHEYWPIDEA